MIVEIIARKEGGSFVFLPRRTRGRSEEVKRRQKEVCAFLMGTSKEEKKKGETEKISPQLTLNFD
tara:strand:+ start:4567 stop:4761 length:195 start_codon:yes stop_codon:yes gene_type:complete